MILAIPPVEVALGPVQEAFAALRKRRGAAATGGLAPGLLVPPGATGWLPAAELVSGRALHELLVAAKQRWNATPHAAAALAWRSYTYWLAMPAVLGWAAARRVPLLDPADVLVRITAAQSRPLVTFGLRRLRLAVRAGDPLVTGARDTGSAAGDPLGTGASDREASAPGSPPAAGPGLAGRPELVLVDSEQQLLAELRATLRDRHLDPLLAQLRTRVNLGSRLLLGSLASAVAYSVVRGTAAAPAEQEATAATLLSVLDLADLVTLEPGPEGPSVKRKTCCLAFTLPEPKVCSGCCLRPAL